MIQTFEHSKSVNCIQVDETSNKLISVSNEKNDKTIKIWSLDTGECLKTMNHHQNCVRNILLISNNKFISGSMDSTIKIWDFESNECLKTLTNDFEYYSLCVLSSNNYLACGCLNGTIVI